MDQVCWVSVLDASESNVRHATRVVAAAVEANKRLFFFVFVAIQKGRYAVLGVAFARLFGTKLGGVLQ